MSNAVDVQRSTNNSASAKREVADATCIACGCLCDDIHLIVENNYIVEAQRACEIGKRFFLADHDSGAFSIATLHGRPVETSKALDRSAEILAEAHRPLIFGLTRTSVETQTAAVALADRIGAVVSLDMESDASTRLQAVQRVGTVSATLGEVKNRADVVVFWGTDPVVTHPRHFERYSVEPLGRFVPTGRAGRTVIVVDEKRTATAHCADHFFDVPADSQFEVLWTLRGLVTGAAVDPSRLTPEVRLLGHLLVSARFGALFYGHSLGRARGGPANVEAALRLVRDLNAKARFVALTLGGPGNPSGVEAVLGWQSGYGAKVDFARGHPRSVPTASNVDVALDRSEYDAALIIANDPVASLSPRALERLREIPTVLVAPDATRQGRGFAVALSSATPGIHTTGTVLRCDGVMLPLRPALTSDRPTDRQYLQEIDLRLKTIRRST
jgi:formylmethanofuran dehydrogenase subunit B